MTAERITSPDHPAMAALCAELASRATDLDRSAAWPKEQLRLCAEFGVFEWFLDPAWGGQDWNEEQIVRAYLALSEACLTTTFIITQRTGATRRIAACRDAPLKQRWLPGLASGELFATVGISHLTTSRRYLAKPVLSAVPISNGFRLEGYAPWVTGGAASDIIVTAAPVLDESGDPTELQVLLAVPTGLTGVTVADPLPLVGVGASSTGPVQFNGVEVPNEQLIAGPLPNVMSSGLGGTTGGHETSTLAIGLAAAAIKFLASESSKRGELLAPSEALQLEHAALRDDLLAIATGRATCSKESLRQRANSLVLRATQAALAAAKGSGYVIGHPAGRWCREALFFLVWSCPAPVAAANLCELAGITD